MGLGPVEGLILLVLLGLVINTVVALLVVASRPPAAPRRLGTSRPDPTPPQQQRD